MKTLALFFLLMFSSLAVFSQNKSIDQFFQKYAGKDGYTSVVITKAMFDLFADMESADDDEYMNMIKNLNQIRILTCTQRPESCKSFYTEAIAAIDMKTFEELMSIDDPGQKVKFLVKKKDAKVSDLLVLVSGVDDNTIIWINGIIDMKTIGKLAKNLEIEGMDKLDTIKEK